MVTSVHGEPCNRIICTWLSTSGGLKEQSEGPAAGGESMYEELL